MEGSKWQQYIPWFLTIACTAVLIIIGKFLVGNIEWYKESVFNSEVEQVTDPEYRFYAYHLHLSMIKRSVGLFSGFAVMFLGLGVAFFTLKNNANFEAEGAGFTAKLVTASPGLVALVVGAYLIITTINSKDEFPMYKELPKKEKVDKSKMPELQLDTLPAQKEVKEEKKPGEEKEVKKNKMPKPQFD